MRHVPEFQCIYLHYICETRDLGQWLRCPQASGCSTHSSYNPSAWRHRAMLVPASGGVSRALALLRPEVPPLGMVHLQF